MDFQFAFGNPRGRHHKKRVKKRLAKRRKSSKLKARGQRRLKIVKVSSTVGGLMKHKRRKKSHTTHRRHKRRRNPEYVKWTKAGQKTDYSFKWLDPRQKAEKRRKIKQLAKKNDKHPSKKLVAQMERLEKQLKASDVKEKQEISESASEGRKGWTGTLVTKFKKRKKRTKVAKRRKKRKSKAKHAKKHHAKKHHAKKHVAKKRKSSPRRRRAKTYVHRHSRKTKHIKKGQSLSGVIYSKGRGRKRLKARVKIKFNPLGGAMDARLREWLGHDVEDAGALALGGLVYGLVNSSIAKYLPSVANMTATVPVVGPGLLPLLVGAVAHKYGGKITALRMIGEGLVGAAIVGMGVAASSKIPGLSGINYTPNMQGINYTPNMQGINYTPNMSGMGIMPQLGASPDFGAADYGSGGYTEGHKFSAADFGDEGDDEYVGLGNSPESQMG